MRQFAAVAMSSLQKKVILRQFAGGVVHGYLPASGFVQRNEANYLNLEGRVSSVPLQAIKTICYVRDFNLSDAVDPERLLRRTFVARPRGEGLWIRITFREDGDVIEGLATADDALLDALMYDVGLYFFPPDTRSNTQRIYVPRAAIAGLQILSVIRSPSRRAMDDFQTGHKARQREALASQDRLFEEPFVSPISRGKHGKS